VHIAVYLPLALPLLAAVSARWIAHRMEPRAATWLLTGSALLLAAASGAALTFLAATIASQIPLLAAVGHWSVRVLHRNDPTSRSLALAACVVLATALIATCRAAALRGQRLASAARTARDLPPAGRLVIIDDPAPDAYALPGWPGRIIVTSGMLGVLDAAERRVLLAHERAHLAGAHYLFVALAQLAPAGSSLAPSAKPRSSPKPMSGSHPPRSVSAPAPSAGPAPSPGG
jgi:Zn-dependent protease with chaperone function